LRQQGHHHSSDRPPARRWPSATRADQETNTQCPAWRTAIRTVTPNHAARRSSSGRVALCLPRDRPARTGHRHTRLSPPRRRGRPGGLPPCAGRGEGNTVRGRHRRRGGLSASARRAGPGRLASRRTPRKPPNSPKRSDPGLHPDLSTHSDQSTQQPPRDHAIILGHKDSSTATGRAGRPAPALQTAGPAGANIRPQPTGPRQTWCSVSRFRLPSAPVGRPTPGHRTWSVTVASASPAM
jgi:hypothetical protein